jgi:hypothetical protein
MRKLFNRTADRARALEMSIRAMWTGNWLKPHTRIQHLNDGARLDITRQRLKSGSYERIRSLRVGPNHVHAFVTHPDGSITDLGISKNLLTNIGRDWMCQTLGGAIPAGGIGSPATATSGTSITATSTPWTASNLATPQLGLATMRVYADNGTSAPVYGNIVSNTTSVATIDQWWTGADGVGSTPSSTAAFIIGAGGLASARFMGLTTNASAPAASDTTLTSEITSGGCGRALATYAHTMGAATFTLQKTFSVTSTFTAIHKMGLFACLTSAGADPVLFESALNVDATVANGDSLTVTDTVTCSG